MIFVAVSENSGEEIYEINKNRKRKLDEHGHLKQKHNLDDIAFEKWGGGNGWRVWRG